MELTINELHFIMKQLEARIEWIKDNPVDSANEEGEIDNCISAWDKLKEIKLELITILGEDVNKEKDTYDNVKSIKNAPKEEQ